MDKEIRLGKFDKWGYKNSFSKGELARELTYMNRDYEKLEQQCQKQQEVIIKAVLELVNIDGNLSNSQLSDRICNLIDILKEVLE